MSSVEKVVAVDDGEWRQPRLGPKQGSVHVPKREEAGEVNDYEDSLFISISFKVQADSRASEEQARAVHAPVAF